MPHSWTAYEFLLPAGTKYFAIRYCADDAMMLMIDDIRYNAAGEDERLTLAGFNIYRNGTKVNDKPVEDFEYADPTASESLNTYVRSGSLYPWRVCRVECRDSRNVICCRD